MSSRQAKIFISSTSRDLAEYRKVLVRSINSLKIFKAVNQEDFGLIPGAPLANCIELVTNSDIFVGIFGHYRGWEVDGDERRRSITEIEYDTAMAEAKPVFAVVAPKEFPVRADLIGTDEKRKRQAAFLQRVTNDHIVSFDLSHPERTANIIVTSVLNHLISQKLLSSAIGSLEPDVIVPLLQPDDEIDARIESALNIVQYKDLSEHEAMLSLRSKQLLASIEGAISNAFGAKQINKETFLRSLGDLFFPFDLEKAKKYYLDFVNVNALDTFVLNRLGQLFYRGGDLVEAIRYYKMALDAPSATGEFLGGLWSGVGC